MDLDNMIRMREELRISEPHQQVNKADKAWWWQNFSAAGETEAGSAAEETEAEDRGPEPPSNLAIWWRVLNLTPALV